MVIYFIDLATDRYELLPILPVTVKRNPEAKGSRPLSTARGVSFPMKGIVEGSYGQYRRNLLNL